MPGLRLGRGTCRRLLVVGGVQVDTESRRVRIADEEIQLTMTEFNLLALLAANAGRVLTRAQLLEKVWGYLAEVEEHLSG